MSSLTVDEKSPQEVVGSGEVLKALIKAGPAIFPTDEESGLELQALEEEEDERLMLCYGRLIVDEDEWTGEF